jgi:hypothetical protein
MRTPRAEAASIIERFVDGEMDSHSREWDAFISIRQADPLTEQVRLDCGAVRDMFPSERAYCSEEGFHRLSELAALLRSCAGGDETITR